MFEERIARGVVYLNETLGTEWPNRINLEELDIRVMDKCVLGQLEHSVTSTDAISLGFLLDEDEYCLITGSPNNPTSYLGRYAILTEEWRETIYDLQTCAKEER